MNKEIAETILAQLGGRRFQVMTGAYNFGFDSQAFSFRLKKNDSKANIVQIKYDYNADLYTVVFQKLHSKTFQLETLSETIGLDVEQTRAHFTSYTGLLLTLGAA